MSDQKQTTNLQNTASNTEPEIDNKELSKIDGELKIPEDNMCASSKTRAEAQCAFSFDEDEMCIENNKSRAEDELPLNLQINNEESGESNANSLLVIHMRIENKLDSENKLPSATVVTIDMKQAGETSLFNSKTETVHTRTSCQQQNEILNESEQRLVEKNQTIDTNDKFHEMWTFLQQDTSNFNSWVNILDMVDCNSDVNNARMAYSKFLELYPLCYGYWMKYANFEKRNDNLMEFKKILEDGLIAIPISVDLWIDYMICLRMDPNNQVDHIRNEFERSLKSCGLDYHSDQLWDDYISWEIEKRNLTNAAKIYYRLIRIPTLNYQNNFFNFQKFIHTNLPEHVLDLTEFHLRRGIIIHTLVTPYIHYLSTDDYIPLGFWEHEITNDIILSRLRDMIIESRCDIHRQTDREFEKRKIYEENIIRPYYHVNALESSEIENWKNYISFEKAIGNCKRTIFLYERCLIACVSTEGFWLDYLDYLSSIKKDVSGVFKRALFHHCKSLQLNLKYFDYAMKKGWVEVTSDTIKKLCLISPTSKEVATRMMNAGDGGSQNGNLC